MVSQKCNQSTIDLIETDLVFMTKVAEKSNMLGEIAGISKVFINWIQELSLYTYLFCFWFDVTFFVFTLSTQRAPLCASLAPLLATLGFS